MLGSPSESETKKFNVLKLNAKGLKPFPHMIEQCLVAGIDEHTGGAVYEIGVAIICR